MNICLNPKTDEAKKITRECELIGQILENNVEEISDEDKTKMNARIMAKLKAGKKLSQKELDYLQKTNPIMYAHALRVQKMAETVEEQLKYAKSKEEANNIIASVFSGLSDKDPDKEYICAAMNRISKKFHESGAYAKLPDTTERTNKKHCKVNNDIFSDADDENENNEMNLRNWSPLTEMYENLPTFNIGA